MRVDIARALCLDRNWLFLMSSRLLWIEIAKVSAYAISKAIRRQKDKKFIAVTCHYDVVDWLEPDWVFCTDTMEFTRKKEFGRPLSSKFIGAAQNFGRCLGTIII